MFALENEVIAIDKDHKTVRVRNHATGEEYEETYDKLILSPGAEPIKPSLPGIDSQRVFTLRNIPDTDAIKEFVSTHRPQNAVVVGGGFIGLEMVENLKNLGLEVDLVEMAPQVMPPLDREMAAFVHHHLRAKGVRLHLGTAVTGFSEQPEGRLQVAVSQGEPLAADLVILAIGVRPESSLAREAGLATNPRGAIITNSRLQTPDPDIYAIGDAIEVRDFVNGSPTVIPLAGPANKQGRIVANNIAGIEEEYHGTQGTSIAKIFDLVVATTGNNEKEPKTGGPRLPEGNHPSQLPRRLLPRGPSHDHQGALCSRDGQDFRGTDCGV